MYVNLNYSVNK